MSDTMPPLPEPAQRASEAWSRPAYYTADQMHAYAAAAVAAERERCAVIAENTATCLLPTGSFLSERVAKAIRATPQPADDPSSPRL